MTASIAEARLSGREEARDAEEQVHAEQILQALRQAESGTTVVAMCRKLGVTETTFYRWKKQYPGLDVSEPRELKQLRDENRRLKGVVADLTIDKAMLRDALGIKW